MALVLGCALLAGLALWSGVAASGRDVLVAAWVLPFTIAVHLVQLFLSALSWRTLIGAPGIGAPGIGAPGIGARGIGVRAIGVGMAWRLRWLREAIDSLLPVAQVGGELVSIRLLSRCGVPPARAAAATMLDLLTEAATLPVVVLAGTVVLWLGDGDLAVLRWVWAGAGLVVAGLAALAAAHVSGVLRVLGRWWKRWGLRSLAVDGLSRQVDVILSDRWRLARAAVWHMCAWSLGAGEVWLALWAIGWPVGMESAFVIEAFGAAARGAGFAIPASLGVQDGGFVLAAGLFGVPVEAAFAMAALKRLREVLVGIAGLILWRLETRRRPVPADVERG